MFIVLVDSGFRRYAIGPFRTAARASAEGLNRFGPLVFGASDRWRVFELEPAK